MIVRVGWMQSAVKAIPYDIPEKGHHRNSSHELRERVIGFPTAFARQRNR